MRCSKCGSDNREGRKFCTTCGTALVASCPKCNAPIELGESFCGECGSSLSTPLTFSAPSKGQRRLGDVVPPAEVVDGERKTVTALFADIKGSMELMEGLDPEEARAIIDPALKLMIEAVCHYDGYIVQSTGDGIFALFGAPVAHEDHPQRALYAALRMQEQMRRYADGMRARGQTPIHVRIGVNTGEVVVRSIQTGGHAEYTPIGHSTSLAARLQTLATPGSTVISGYTRGFVEGYFQLKNLGRSVVKGASEPVELFEVTGLGPLRTRLQAAARRGLTRFVGRDAEMAQMRRSLELAREGHGQIVAVTGDPGVGKSRLFFEFKAVAEADCLVFEGYSISHGKGAAYLPVIELLREYFEIESDDDERKRRERILGKVLRLDRALEDTLPYFYSLLGISEAGDSLAQMDPQIRRRRTHEAIKRILLRESVNQVLIVVFEDLHWIDPETQALLNLLVDALGNARILLLVNYRPEYRHEWGSRTDYAQFRLDPLGRESAEEMLATLLGDGKDLIPLKRLITERTQGTPFFMEEMVQALFEEGILKRNGTVKLAQPISGIKVPTIVQALLASRIDRLFAPEKELLQTLAVLGREFTLKLVQRVTLKSSDELEPMLDQLQLGEFIYEQPAVGEVEYTFKHALTQEVAYNSVLIERRKALHERTGEAIERLFADRLDDHVTELAHHYDRSGNVSKAFEYLERAARRAAERSTHSEVMGYVNRAFELINRLPHGTERARYELELQLTLSASLLVARGLGSPEREQALARSLELCEQLGDSRMIEVLMSLASVRWSRSEPLLALELLEKSLALAEQAKDRQVLAAVHAGIGWQLFLLGRFEETREHLRRAIELSGGGPIGKFGYVFMLAQAAPALLSHVLLVLGYPILASKQSKDALDAVPRRSVPYLEATALTMYALTSFGLRDVRDMAEQVEELTVITVEHEIPIYHAVATFCRAWLTADAGRVKEGLGEMEHSVTRLLGALPTVEWLVVALAEVCRRNELPDEGLAIVQEALTRCEKTPYLQAEFYRLKGELTLLKDPHREAEAERCLRRAIEVAQRQQAKWLELRATVAFARLLAKHSHRNEARLMLADVYGWFTEGFDTADLREAKALLDELSAPAEGEIVCQHRQGDTKS